MTESPKGIAMTAFALSGPITLDARVMHGSLSVQAREGITQATVELTPHQGAEGYVKRFVVEMRGSVLTVHAPRGLGGKRDVGRNSVDAEITVPTGTALSLATSSAAVTVSGRSAACDVVTGSGHIRLDTIDGDLRLRGGACSVQVLAVTGTAHLRTGSGRIRLGDIGGALTAVSGSGRLEVDTVHGAVHARCGSGTALLKAVYGNVDLLSGSGETTIGLPAGVSARLDVTSGSGRVRSELPLEDHQSGGGPAIAVRVRCGSGDLTLVRAA